MLTKNQRFKMYIDVSKVEPLTWTKYNYAFRVYTNVFCTNLMAWFFLKNFVFLYDIDHIKSMKYNNPNLLKSRLGLKFLVIVSLVSGLEYGNYFLLDKYIYEKNYSHLTDDEMQLLYDSTVGKEYLEKEKKRRFK